MCAQRSSKVTLPSISTKLSRAHSSPNFSASAKLRRSLILPIQHEQPRRARVTSPAAGARLARADGSVCSVSSGPSASSSPASSPKSPGTSSSRSKQSTRSGARAKQLRHKDEKVRASAIKSLCDQGSAALSPHVVTLGQLLQDESADVLVETLDALRLVGMPASSFVGQIVGLLKHKCPTVRAAAVEALGAFGPSVAPHIDSIAAMLNDEKFAIRFFAMCTLGDLKEAAAPYGDALARFLTDPNPSGRKAAVQAFGKIGKPAACHAPALAPLLRDECSSMRQQTLEALSSMDEDAHGTYEQEISELLLDPEFDVRLTAVKALKGLAHHHLATIAARLDDDNEISQRFVIEVLSGFGHIARDHVWKILRIGSHRARHAAVTVLCQMGEARLLMRHQDPTVRRITVQALGEIGPVAACYTDALVCHLSDAEQSVRDAAEKALVSIGGDICPQFTTQLLPSLHADDANIRRAVVSVLGSLGEVASPYANEVADLLWDWNADVQAAATSCLQKMGHAGEEHLNSMRLPLKFNMLHAKQPEVALLEIACERLGWTISIEGCGVIWTHGKDNMLEHLAGLRSGDFLSHIPVLGSLLWKVPLAEALLARRASFWPCTWCVPETDLESHWTGLKRNRRHFGQSFESVSEEAFAAGPRTLIVKPSAGSQGKGICLARTRQELQNALEMLPKPEAIIQEYIDRPLLIDGHKWDARIYALVLPVQSCDNVSGNSPWDSFACFLAHEGLVRFCVDPYEHATARNLHRTSAHLTNYSLSKLSTKFDHNEDPNDAFRGTKRTLSAVLQRLESDGMISSQQVWQKLGVIVKDTIDAITEPLLATAFDKSYWDDREEIVSLIRSRFYQCFQVLGFDVLLDEDGEVWLLEVNSAPSLDISEVVPRLDLPQSITEINKVFNAATQELRGPKTGRLCRCAALPVPHIHQQSAVDIAVKLPAIEGALTTVARARANRQSGPEAWAAGTIYEYLSPAERLCDQT